MKRNAILIFAMISVFLGTNSCQRDYTCVCYNPGGATVAFTINSTKSEAKEACQEYYEENFGTIEWSETHCEVD